MGEIQYLPVQRQKNTVEDGPLKVLVDSVPQVDLLVLTHIDDDHIAGILKWFEGDENACEKVKKSGSIAGLLSQSI